MGSPLSSSMLCVQMGGWHCLCVAKMALFIMVKSSLSSILDTRLDRQTAVRWSHQSCFRTAWPFRVSTLKLLVLAGMMKKATTNTADDPLTSPRSQAVRKPKRTASLASRSNHGTPMEKLTHSSLFQRSSDQAVNATSMRTT
ncbi:hypothetical protein CRUP_005362 [Coryphaenoides rupestris]|nr:hypothetical protein CRUP_005362 [Coryphaenoides rupestris]